MKKTVLFLSLFFFISFVHQAAIPLSNKVDQKKETLEKPAAVKKTSILHRLLANNKPTEDSGLFNILSLISGVLGVIATAFTVTFGIPFIIAAIVLGILGLARKEKYQGMGIAGISLGGGMILLFILAVFLVAIAFGGC